MTKEFTTQRGRFAVISMNESDNSIKIPDGYKVFGFASKLTEEQWKDIVDFRQNAFPVFYDYINKFYSIWGKGSATESGQSLMASIGMPIVNPLGKEPILNGKWVTKEGIDNEYNEYEETKKHKVWRAKEDKIKEYLILKKVA